MMKKAFITILTLGFVLALGLPSAYAADMDCGNFSTWAEAQKYFEDNGGSPTNNFNDLDRDHDGMACDSLAGAPANWSWDTAHPGGTTGGTQAGLLEEHKVERLVELKEAKCLQQLQTMEMEYLLDSLL